jgi:hypothetical protein
MPAMDEPPQIDRTKIRLGLALVSVVVVVAIVLFLVVDDGLGRAVMFGVALAGFIRIYLLTRALRSGEG